jgi:uncharacterized protein YndB with AHSA1/START domain
MNAFGSVIGPTEVRFERLLPGPIETVWEFLVDSKKRGEWFASGPMEPRVGGTVELNFKHQDLSPNKAPPPERYKEMDKTGHKAKERVIAIDPPRLLTITFAETSEVTFELIPKGTDVLLVLTHRKIAHRGDMVSFAGGWHAHLDILVEKAWGRVPDAFWTVWQRIDGEYEKRIPKSGQA